MKMNDLSTTMEASAGAANLAWFLPRSPARQALSTHHAAVEAAVRGVAALREPVARAQGIVAEADAALREAETAVGAIDAAQVEELAAAAKPSPRAARASEPANAKLAD
jgi:hypothetical protein